MARPSTWSGGLACASGAVKFRTGARKFMPPRSSVSGGLCSIPRSGETRGNSGASSFTNSFTSPGFACRTPGGGLGNASWPRSTRRGPMENSAGRLSGGRMSSQAAMFVTEPGAGVNTPASPFAIPRRSCSQVPAGTRNSLWRQHIAPFASAGSSRFSGIKSGYKRIY